MMMPKLNVYGISLCCLMMLFGTTVQAQIPVDDPQQLVEFLIDKIKTQAVNSMGEIHKMYDEAAQKIIGVQNAATKMLQQNGLEKAMLGKSDLLNGAAGTGEKNGVVKLSEDIIPLATLEEKMEKTTEELQKMEAERAKQFQEMSVNSLARAWMAQTEASAKTAVLTQLGKDINNNADHTNTVISLVRISTEQAADLNARSTIAASHLSAESIMALEKVK